MESSLPQTLKKQITLIEGALYSDKYNRNAEYQRIINKTQSRERVYDILIRKYGNSIETKADTLCEKCSVIMEKLGIDLLEIMNCFQYIQSKKELHVQIDILTKRASSYYEELGKIIKEYSLLDILIERNDNVLNKQGITVLKIDSERAMDEFKVKPYAKTSYVSELMKILFYTNKIAKFIQDIEFGTMLNLDRINANTRNDERIQLLSNLKTHYLFFILEEQEGLSEEELRKFDEEGLAKKEYIRLFKDDFNNLDYEKELEIVKSYKEKIKKVYLKKSELTDMILAFGLHEKYRKYVGQEVKRCGVCKDEKGKLVLGMNIQGYVMPLTVHISKENLASSINHENEIEKREKGFSTPIKIEEYNPLRGNNGKVVKTNLVYKINKIQMEKLRKLAKSRPDDKVLQFYNKQISRENTSSVNMVDPNDLLK